MLFLGIWTLVPWALAAIAIGYWCGKRHAMLSGAVFGFALSFAFMLFNYTGSAPVMSRFPGFALLGLVGAACATVLAFVGSSARARFGR